MIRLCLLLFVLLFLNACDETTPVVEERTRAIKPYYVVEPASGRVRRYSGTVIAANTSSMSFAVAGTVAEVLVNAGDHVSKGQRLATLDAEPFQLDLQASQAELSAAQAEYANQKIEVDRQTQLLERGWVAKSAYDQAVTSLEAAESQLNLARSRLGLAERDLNNTRLLAPYDGVIASRDVDAFVEVSKGQAIFQINAEASFEVALSVPDSIVSQLVIGAPVSFDSLTVDTCGCSGRITEIGAAANAANAVTVKATILDGAEDLIAGMAVEATLVLHDDNQAPGLLVPLTAIAPGDDDARGYVYKFDAERGVVVKTAVTSAGVISGNLVGINEGVSSGDIIAMAGVSFLRDGQAVKLLNE
ncbi:MAG: efflux RND transporter periplasmic adaptor subunit [Xanthomonadales bacterium]|jgi:RND family efflux transporter MFP subunit|nr:efflux RND transporter periplasmic adaptor subunit [Xanthomonadales bacterium]